MLYVASGTWTGVAAVTAPDPERSEMAYVRGGVGAGVGASWVGEGCGAFGPQGIPIVKPPWGRITAIDLNTGDHVWMAPNGEPPDCIENHPALQGVELSNTGKPERSGIMVTKTLVFAGEGSGLRYVSWAGGPIFRAYDKMTGEIVWEFELPGNQTGNPMTYMIDGRQYIVVAVGARNQPAELVALALP